MPPAAPRRDGARDPAPAAPRRARAAPCEPCSQPARTPEPRQRSRRARTSSPLTPRTRAADAHPATTPSAESAPRSPPQPHSHTNSSIGQPQLLHLIYRQSLSVRSCSVTTARPAPRAGGRDRVQAPLQGHHRAGDHRSARNLRFEGCRDRRSRGHLRGLRCTGQRRSSTPILRLPATLQGRPRRASADLGPKAGPSRWSDAPHAAENRLNKQPSGPLRRAAPKGNSRSGPVISKILVMCSSRHTRLSEPSNSGAA